MLIRSIDYHDPCGIFSLFSHEEGSVFLDSVPAPCDMTWPKGTGDYSFIGLYPRYMIQSKNDCVTLNKKPIGTNPFDVLENILDECKKATSQSHDVLEKNDIPPWSGGLLGYFGYDLLHHLENVPPPAMDDMGFDDMMVGLYELGISFDHRKQKAFVFFSPIQPNQGSLIAPHPFAHQAEKYIHDFLNQLKEKIAQSTATCPKPASATVHHSPFSCSLDINGFPLHVQKVKDYILAGDIFQANLTRRFQTTFDGAYDWWSLYTHLRHKNPAPFSGFLNFGRTKILSSSPERFIQVNDDKVQTRPIKGTRKRYPSDPIFDQQMQNELINSEKDRAENVMIVDLLRNDLSRVCEPHSVKVTNLLGLETYATVHHLVSTIEGALKPGTNVIQLLKATFPGGSITGAPKVRAMEIIHELEPNRRGPYCGAMGYIGWDGQMDTNIIIRTFCIKDDVVTVQTGCGIVVDSDPMGEYEESEVKAAALLGALENVSPMGSKG
jgi:para-aminobenzoate synthetase component 1